MNIIKFLFLFIFIHGCGCTGAFGQALKVGDFKTMSGVTYHQNFVKNPGAEFSVTSGIAVSGGALTRQPTSSSYGSGNYYFQWIPVAQNDTVTLYFDSLPGLLSNSASRKNCQGKINIGTTASGPNASAGFKVGLYAGVTLIEEKTFSGNAAYTEQAMKELIFGATGCSRGIDRIIITNTGTVNPTIVFDEAWFSEFYLQTVQNRYFAKLYRGGSTQTGVGPNNNDVKINPNTLDFDQLGIVNLTNNRFEFKGSYTCNFSGRVSLLNTNILNATYYYVKIKKNNVDMAAGNLRVTSGAGQYLSEIVVADSIQVVSGDNIELYLSGTGNNSSSTLTADIGLFNTFLTADCTPAASQAITPQNYNYAPRPYTPTISAGAGTATNLNFRESRQDNFLNINYSFTAGTVTGAGITFTLPSGLEADIPTSSAMGTWYSQGTVPSGALFIATATPNLVYFGNGTNWQVNLTGTQLGTGSIVSGFMRVPIKGWGVTQGAPQIVNSVTSNNSGSLRIESAYVSGAGVVSNESSDFINGNCSGSTPFVCNFNSGTWAASPNVACIANSNETPKFASPTSVTNSSVTIATNNLSGSNSAAFNLICFGARP